MDDLIKSACPFCGSKDIRFMGYPGMYTNSHCECKDCNTIGPAVFVDDKKAAIAAWNRRAVPQASAGQDALKLSRYDWLVSNAFIFEFFSGDDAHTSIATSYCYSGSDEDFTRWTESQIDAAIRAASKTTPSSGEGSNADQA